VNPEVELNSSRSKPVRFQEQIDKVKEAIKSPCADFLSVELKFKPLKKDILKAKRSKDKEDKEKDVEEEEQARSWVSGGWKAF